MKVLLINSLDVRYGSTYRARMIYRICKDIGLDITYLESNHEDNWENTVSTWQIDNIIGYLWSILHRLIYCTFTRYDLLFVCKLNILTFPCILMGMIFRKRIIVDWDDLDSSFQKNTFRKFLCGLVENNIPKYIPTITTHNDYIKRFAISKGAVNVYIINTGIDLTIFNPDIYDYSKIKNEMGLNEKYVFGYLGTLTGKGAEDLIYILKLFKNICEVNDENHLLIIGGGKEEHQYIDIIDIYGLIKNVSFTGLVDRYEVPKYLAAVDCALIYMSNNDGNKYRLSHKMLEYLAMEKEIIGHLVGISEVIFKGYYENIGEQTDNYIKIISCRKKHNNEKVNYKAREFITKYYDWKISQKQIHDIIFS